MPPQPPYRVLIEASKLMEADGDGVKRYLVELLTAFTRLPDEVQANWQFDLYIYGDIIRLEEYRSELRIEVAQRKFGLLWYERYLLAFKALVQRVLPRSVYNALAPLYRHSPLRWLLQRLKKGGKAVKRLIFPLAKDSRFAPYHLIHLPLPQHEDPFEGLDVPIIATIHDLTHELFPQWHQPRNIRLAKKGMRFLMKRGAHFIAVSQSTASDLGRLFEVSKERVHVVHEAADGGKFFPNTNPARALEVRQRYGIPEGAFLLTLSTIEPRKNLLRTIRAYRQFTSAFQEAGIRLVVAGKYGWKSRGVYKGIDLDAGDIIFTGFIAEADLPVLYSEALALCYLSLYEGFGLPPLEAMGCGTPVVFGNNSSMPEVIGEGGLGVEAADEAAIARAMADIALDDDLRTQLAEAAVNRAATFSWEIAADSTLQAYAAAIGVNWP